MTNTWPGGYRHAMHQDEHEAWNAENYPGTRELCVKCEAPTGRCDEDSMWVEDVGPLCEDCYRQAAEPDVSTNHQPKEN